MNTYHGKECSKHHITLRMKNNRQCRECHLEAKRNWGKKRKRNKVNSMIYSRLRQQKLLNAALPGWNKEINMIYSNRKNNEHVDHIVPLVGIDPITKIHIVCGLHVPWNLQIVAASVNGQKWSWWQASK